MEEERRRQEAEALERQFRESLLLSIRYEAQDLEQSLLDVTHGQYVKLDDTQGREEQAIISAFEFSMKDQLLKADGMEKKVASNTEQKLKAIETTYEDKRRTLRSDHEAQEDETFMQIQLFLRGKPNKEAREERMLAELRQQQASDVQKLEHDLERESGLIRTTAEREAELLKRATETSGARLRSKRQLDMSTLAVQTRVARHWFCLISTRRAKLVEMHNQLMLDEFERGVEPIGLTREIARTIQPLPVIADLVSDDASATGFETLQSNPAGTIARRSPAPSSNDSSLPSLSSWYTTSSDDSFVSTIEHGSSDNYTVLTPQQSLGSMNHSELPAPLATRIPSNGPAFIANKNGESSKPVELPIHFDGIAAPPTPPDTPPHLFTTRPPVPRVPVPSTELYNPNSAYSAPRPKKRSPFGGSHWSSAFDNPVPIEEKHKGRGKQKEIERLSGTSNETGMTAAGDSAKAKEGRKGSRWQFWRKEELTPEEMRDRLSSLRIGDAF